MDKQRLIKLVGENGWKKIVKNSNYMGHNFDIVGERKFVLTKWHLLVKFIDNLNEKKSGQLKNMFSELTEKSKGLFLGKCFLLCIIAKTINPSIVKGFKLHSFGLFGFFRLEGGGGRIFLLDEKNKKIYGEVPSLPYDVSVYSRDLKEILEQVI